jgi:chaperone modulatory protein CbpM
METREFLLVARLEARALDAWIEEGWLLPRRTDEDYRFSDVDLARAQLIGDLVQLGVNNESIPIILDLVDQLHGMRRNLQNLLSAIAARPEPGRRHVPDRDQTRLSRRKRP